MESWAIKRSAIKYGHLHYSLIWVAWAFLYTKKIQDSSHSIPVIFVTSPFVPISNKYPLFIVNPCDYG